MATRTAVATSGGDRWKWIPVVLAGLTVYKALTSDKVKPLAFAGAVATIVIFIAKQ
jgi:hypothetical protein